MKNIFEMSTVFSTGMENAIVLSWNGGDLSKYEKQKEMAMKTVEYLKGKGLSGKAEHLTGYYPTTKKWWDDLKGSKTSSSKTDLKIGDARISLKVGSAQLMSGGKEEAKATLYAVSSILQHKEAIDEISKIIDTFVHGIADNTVGKARKYDDLIKKGDEIHKQLNESLTNLFNNNSKFKIDFLREAISGAIKFGDKTDACANYILSLKDKQPYLKYIDDSTIKSIASHIKVNTSYKTDSMGGKNIGKYSYRSALRILVSKITEELEHTDINTLNENMLTDFWQKIKDFVTDLMNKIKDYLSTSIQNVFSFLEIEPIVEMEGEIEL